MPRQDPEEHRQFREYFVARHDTVRRTAYMLCGDWHWADDLTQSAFRRLAVSWRTVNDRQALDAFVRTCLMRAYFSDLRRVWRRRERSVASPPDVAVTSDGSSADRDVSAPAVGVLHRVEWREDPDHVDADTNSPERVGRHLVSTDGGRNWTELRRVDTPVDAVPAGGWLECEDGSDAVCVDLLVYDPAGGRIAPLRTRPGFTIVRVADVPSAVGFWLSGYDAATRRNVLAVSPDRGRTWTTHADGNFSGPVSADGVIGYCVVVDGYPVKPTGPSPTSSPTESRKRVYRTGDGGRSWQRVDPDRTLPDGALTVVQSYVA